LSAKFAECLRTSPINKDHQMTSLSARFISLDSAFNYVLNRVQNAETYLEKSILFIFNPILHTWFRDSCFTCVGSPTIQVFPMIFYIGMVI
jgi:hypothetical protein